MNNNVVDKIGAPFLSKERNKNMKTTKSQGVLYIFDMLKEYGYVTKSDVMSTLCISELSFWRYIQELKAYIYNFNCDYDIVYNKNDDKYYLIEHDK